MKILTFVFDHWDIISTIILFIISTIIGVKKLKLSAYDSAKEIGSRLIFGIEKKADEYLTSDSGQAKFKLVVENGYNLFNSKTRLFISKPMFETIVQNLHDEGIKFLETEIKKQTPVLPVETTPTENKT